MLIDTHCHLNMLIKESFDKPLSLEECQSALSFIEEAKKQNVTYIINVGTSFIESQNSTHLARLFKAVYSAIGLHPNDCTPEWKKDFTQINRLVQEREKNKIVAIGECGLDYHYPEYNKQRQEDAFKAQIELALEYNFPLIIHTRDAGDETLKILEQFKDNSLRGVIHCFSENLAFAQDAFKLNFVLGIGGTITYPKNNILREVVKTIPLEQIILETDAPFLPPQQFRGKKNTPAYIPLIAQYIAELRAESFDHIAQVTSDTAIKLFNLPVNKA